MLLALEAKNGDPAILPAIILTKIGDLWGAFTKGENLELIRRNAERNQPVADGGCATR